MQKLMHYLDGESFDTAMEKLLHYGFLCILAGGVPYFCFVLIQFIMMI
ncbi:hypothetical protein ABES25_11610 [Bacillus gobiensis]